MSFDPSSVQSTYYRRDGHEATVSENVCATVSETLRRASTPSQFFDTEQTPIVGSSLMRRRRWGTHLQLPGLIDCRTWGIGDYGSLQRLGEYLALSGADFVAIGPTSWESYDPISGSLDPSPYSPVSRFLQSINLIAIPEVPGWKRLSKSLRTAYASQAEILNQAATTAIDRQSVLALKASALRVIFVEYRQLLPENDVHEIQNDLASCLVHYLKFRGVSAAYFGDLSADLYVDFILWTQRVANHQIGLCQNALRWAGMDIGIVSDLPVGSARNGIDHLAYQGCYTSELSIGTPPDQYVPEGQNWDLAFPVPHETDQEICAQALALRQASALVGGVRVDHVLGLHRLWARIPGGKGIGTYVHYDFESNIENLRALVRAGKFVVGEDLGNVPTGLRESLQDGGIYGTDVLWWSRGSDGSLRTGIEQQGRSQAMLVTGFHDTSSLARMLTGDDLKLLSGLGRLGQDLSDARRQRQDDLDEFDLHEQSDSASAVTSIYSRVFAASADSVSIYYPDFQALACTENVPGTGPNDYANWCASYGDAHREIEEQLGSPLANQLLSLTR